jgi:hypothetical protein
MATIRSAVDLHALSFTSAKAEKRATGPNWFVRAITLLQQARLRQAEREVARFLGGAGAKFTDETEREIERRFLSNDPRF